jgi:protein involved in ribonucleotide reduction
MKKEIKQDINFLENPMWIQRDRRETSFVLKQGGFTLSTQKKPPTKLDALFLYYLLWVSQENNWTKEVVVSHHEVLKNTGVDTGGKYRKRLKESLTRWTSILLEFQGNFYDGVEYKNLVFHVIDSWEQREDNLLRIHFSEKWLTQIQNSSFFEKIELKTLTTLKSPLSTRLYEILSKNFHNRSEWRISAKKLASKIPMNEQYVSHIIPKIQSAVKKIKKRTELKIDLEVQKEGRGKALLIFRKEEIKKQTTLPHIVTKSLQESPPEQENSLVSKVKSNIARTSRLEGVIARGISDFGETYVLSQILYANEKAKDNYPRYLESSLSEDWAKEERRKQEQESLKVKQRKKERKQKEKQELQEEKQFDQASLYQHLANNQFSVMSKEAKEALKQQAIEAHPAFGEDNDFARRGLKIQMLQILTQHFKQTIEGD